RQVCEWLIIISKRYFIYFFFFQAEDGIRDRNVTGVQTCALPICDPGEKGDKGDKGDTPDLKSFKINGNNKISISKFSKHGEETPVNSYEIEEGIIHFSDVIWKIYTIEELNGVKHVFRDRKSTRLN